MGLQCRNGRLYYTTSRRVNGKVKREYVASGALALYAYERDQVLRREAQEARQQQEAQWRQEREAADALDEAVNAVCDGATGAFRTVMDAAGYHQHARGQWRKKRPEKQEDIQDGS